MSGKIELTAIANRCSSGACPTIYTTDSIDEGGLETVVVQGFAVSAQRAGGVDVPAGELLVEIPRALLEEAVRNLS